MDAEIEICGWAGDDGAEVTNSFVLLRCHRNRVRSGSEPLPDEVDVAPEIVHLIGKISGYANPANGCVDVLKLRPLGR